MKFTSFTQQSVANIRLNDYVTLVILVAVGYDYILALSDELEYIWNRPWTRVSTLFILVRYLGLLTVIIDALMGVHSYLALERRGILEVLSGWAMMIFMSAADLTMILRVWALCGRSKLILCTLLTLCALQAIPYLIYCLIVSTVDPPTVVTIRVLDLSFCMASYGSPIWSDMIGIVQIILGAFMFLIVVTRFIKEAFQMYKVTKQFRLNRYMNLLVREGIVYFLTVLGFQLVDMLISAGSISPGGWQMMLIGTMEPIVPFTIAPRFILSLRKVYARDLQTRRGDEIDSAFILPWASGGNTVASAMVFANGGQNEELEQGEEIQIAESRR